MLCRLGEVEFNVVSEEEATFSSDITDRPVEEGVNVTDHVKREPRTLVISGYVTDSQAAQKVGLLRQYSTRGEVLPYRGRNFFNNLVIDRLTTQHEIVGFTFDITLKEVRIARRKTFTLDNPQGRSILEQGLQVVRSR